MKTSGRWYQKNKAFINFFGHRHYFERKLRRRSSIFAKIMMKKACKRRNNKARYHYKNWKLNLCGIRLCDPFVISESQTKRSEWALFCVR